MATTDGETKFDFNPTMRLMFMAIISLMAIGVLMVYSASLSVKPGSQYTFFVRHLIFVPLAILALGIAMRFPYQKLNRAWVAVGLLSGSVALLVLVLPELLGQSVNGSFRWFRFALGPMEISFQPSELAKLSVIIFFAWYLARPQLSAGLSFKDFAILTGVLGAVCGLIAYQDLGTAALIGALGVGLMLAGGVRLWHVGLLVPPTAGALYLLLTAEQYQYRMQRLTAYVDPWRDPQGTGYHIIQSLIAIGSGGWFGLGLGNGIQKYGYLPEDTTDFIYSIICEEMGVAGGAVVILLFLGLALLGLRIVKATNSRFAFLAALGIVLWVGLQPIINIGVATGALPTKGIGLPLVSYGGSSLVLTAAALGLLMSIGSRMPALSSAKGEAAQTNKLDTVTARTGSPAEGGAGSPVTPAAAGSASALN